MSSQRSFNAVYLKISRKAKESIAARCVLLSEHLHIRAIDQNSDALENFVSQLQSSEGISPELFAGLLTLAVFAKYPQEADTAAWAFLIKNKIVNHPLDIFLSLDPHSLEKVIEHASEVSLFLIPQNSICVDISTMNHTHFVTGIQRVVLELLQNWTEKKYQFVPFSISKFTLMPCVVEQARMDELLHRYKMGSVADQKHELNSPLRQLYSWIRLRMVNFLKSVVSPKVFQFLRMKVLKAERPRFFHERVPVLYGAKILLPEIPGVSMVEFYRSLHRSGRLNLNMIVYDFIPLLYPEFCELGDQFIKYLTLFQFANKVSCISKTTAQTCETLVTSIEHSSQLQVMSHLLPSGLSASENMSLNSSNASDTPIILCVGTIDPRKNHLSLLRAAQILKRRGLKFKLVIVGALGWFSKNYLMELQATKERGVDVEWINGPSDAVLKDLYWKSKFTVFCPFVEGFGLPILESLSFSRPCVTSNRSSMKEIAEGGGCLTVDPYSIEDLAVGMGTLLTDQEKYETLKNEIRKIKFKTWDEYGKEIFEMTLS